VSTFELQMSTCKRYERDYTNEQMTSFNDTPPSQTRSILDLHDDNIHLNENLTSFEPSMSFEDLPGCIVEKEQLTSFDDTPPSQTWRKLTLKKRTPFMFPTTVPIGNNCPPSPEVCWQKLDRTLFEIPQGKLLWDIL
jgi:hypothetical protein